MNEENSSSYISTGRSDNNFETFDVAADAEHGHEPEIENPNPSIATPEIPNEMPARDSSEIR